MSRLWPRPHALVALRGCALLAIPFVQVMDEIHPALRQLLIADAVVILTQCPAQPLEGGHMLRPIGRRQGHRKCNVASLAGFRGSAGTVRAPLSLILQDSEA